MFPPGPEIASVEEASRWRFFLAARGRLDTAVLLLLIFFYAWLAIDPRLVHHSLGILAYYYPFSFHSGAAVLRQHLARPGGLAEYGLRLLTQDFALGWPGALILAAIAWQLAWSTDQVGRWAGNTRSRNRLLRWVPGVLVLMLYGSYSHPLGALLSLQCGLVAASIYVRRAPQGDWQRAAWLLAAAAVLYHAAGSGSILFPALVAIYEWRVARRPRQAAVAVGAALAVPSLAAVGFSSDLRDAYAGFLRSDPGLLPGQWPLIAALFAFYPLLLAASRWAVVRESPASRRSHRSHPPPRSRPPGPDPTAGRNRLVASAALLALLGGFALWYSLDTLARTVLLVDLHAQRERWPQALAAADRLPPGFYDVRCHRNVMLALYHTQQLGEAMFRYPQRPGVDLFSTPPEASDLGSLFQESRLFLELGHVNQAEKGACEILETVGDLPTVLEQLALIQVVKGRPETARIFYQALARQPLQRRGACAQLARLAADPQQAADARVAQLRRNMVARDYVALDTSVEQFLALLLERNPRNRLAFELLMAHYLAVGRPDGVVAGLSQLQHFSYARMPQLYQEAAVIYARSGGGGGKPPAIPGYALDAAVLARGEQFFRLTAAARNREAAIQSARAAGFGDSYFFYWAFGFSGP